MRIVMMRVALQIIIRMTDQSSWQHDEGSHYDLIYKMSPYLMQLKIKTMTLLQTTKTLTAVVAIIVRHQKVVVVVIDVDVSRSWDYYNT